MPSTPCTSHHSTAFCLNITLGYGADNKTEEDLYKACLKQTSALSEMASSFFSGSSTAISSSAHTSIKDITNNHQNQDRFFVTSASHVRLSVNPSEKFWKTNTYLIVVFVPPHMIASGLEKHCSSNHVASGSSIWIDPPSSANFSQDLLPKIHPTALSGCRIRGIVLTSIAANNGPAEMLLLEVPKGRSIHDDILRATSGGVIAGDSNLSVLKILPITTIEFTHDKDDDGKTLYSENKMGQTISMNINSDSSSSTAIPTSHIVTPQIPTCPICIHRIDPIRLGLPAPCVQQLCSKFCPSPSLIVGSWGTEEESCQKQRLLVSTILLYQNISGLFRI